MAYRSFCVCVCHVQRCKPLLLVQVVVSVSPSLVRLQSTWYIIVFFFRDLGCHRRRADRARPLRRLPDNVCTIRARAVCQTRVSVSVLLGKLCKKPFDMFARFWFSVRHLTARNQYRTYVSFLGGDADEAHQFSQLIGVSQGTKASLSVWPP